MKKAELIRLVTASLTCAALIAGCGSEETVITESDYTITDNTSPSGITLGSAFSDFAVAYENYPLQILGTDGSYQPYELPDLDKDPSAGDVDMTLMASCFFEDGEAVTTTELLEETGVTADELDDTLAGSDYLSKHTLVYRYMIFNFENGSVSGLSSDYLDYNNELY